jgi:hypothetical protein
MSSSCLKKSPALQEEENKILTQNTYAYNNHIDKYLINDQPLNL